MRFRKNIQKLIRAQTSQDRDLSKGVVLDRNERVDYFDKKIFLRILKKFSRHSLNTNPIIKSLYVQLSKFHKVNTNNIYITQGITECMAHIMFSMTKDKDEVVIMEPTYPMYEVLCKLHGIKYRQWKFKKNLNLEINDLKKLINRRTKVLFLVNPNLPIEYEFNKKIKNQIYKICKEKNILIVYDEAYHNFGSESEIKNSTKLKNLIVMRTFSKAWGLPGIRLGYMVSNHKLTNYISKCRSLVETNALSYQVGLWALKNKFILNDHVKEVKRGEKFLNKKFKSIKEKYHGGKVTNAILLKLKSKKLTEKLRIYLSKKNIYIRNGFSSPIEDCVRISLCSPKKLSIFFKNYLHWKKKIYKKI